MCIFQDVLVDAEPTAEGEWMNLSTEVFMKAITLQSAANTVTTATSFTELVRGNDQVLLERITPLVRRESVLLDLGSVERIDAAGIAALILLYRCALESGHDFTVSNASARVAQVLTLVGLDHILLFHNMVQCSHSGPRTEPTAA
jgi:anti-anti-sigma factor